MKIPKKQGESPKYVIIGYEMKRKRYNYKN